MIESEVYSTAHYMATCGDAPASSLSFGFRSVGVRIYNSCGPRLFYALRTGAATTKSDFLACASAQVFEVNALGVSLKTTSTADAAGQPYVGVSAWASA